MDDERAFSGFLETGQSVAHDREGFRNPRRQPFAGLRQRNLPRPPQEKRLADGLLEQLDLVADGCLRQPELLAGLGEAHMPGCGLEHPQSVERELSRHVHG